MVTASKLSSSNGASSSALASTKASRSAKRLPSARSRPTASISPLMSETVTSAGSDRRAMRKAMSPVPPAMSSTRKGTGERRGGESQVTKASFHRRWTPPDMRSFIRS